MARPNAAPARRALFRLADLEGQDPAKATIQSALKAGRIPSAWLFTGPTGVGRAGSALAVAAAANCLAGVDAGGGLFGAEPPVEATPREDACGACPSCRKVAQGNHPDVRVVCVPEEKRQIPIEAVREAIGELAFRPYEGRRRFVIVDGAEHLTPQASNALLKSLEEPPSHSGWILIAEAPSRLLPTVVSRCRVVRFGAIPAEVAARVLARQTSIPADEARVRAALLGGSIGRALGEESARYARESRAAAIDGALEAVRGGGGKIVDVAEEWVQAAKSEELPVETLIEHLAGWLRDVAVRRATPGERDLPLLNSDLADRVEALSAKADPRRIARAFDAVRRCARDLEGNVNEKLALETMLLALRRELA